MIDVPDFQEKDRLAHVVSQTGYRKARRLGLDAADADDAVQEVGLHVLLQRFDTVRDHATPEALLVSHVGYRCLDKHKEHRRRVQREESLTQWDEPASAKNTEDRVSHLTRTPELLTVPHPVERVIELEGAKQQVAKVAAVVRGFSLRRRRIFGLCIVRKRPRREVAKKLGISYGTLRNEVVEINKLLREAVFGAQDA
jgi:RNA polymerase sigma factor (sigma-70 family)